ncbi:putative acetyl-CoA--deacetylcephalosporin C acetyltransferase precursor [Rhizodiscina lignyota]|uniref:Acetyl-CoA--deacetylcephalosporin C acetyltransferase n=1 Tax=Rhizodiscina lignyota TaxID=1504668 RepID=A0A9P4IRF5_9PEZI|nr:putative acetyl-CoA--deacetylcephalosporin C acetyltransferase precursor [Rhizodiscina lignyota]
MRLTSQDYAEARLESSLAQEHHYSRLIRNQKFAVIPSFTLESGETLSNCQIAYKTWGKLNDKRDNVLVVCHALTGSSDLVDWWHPLFGPGKTLDPTRFFIFCGNCLGSPYGSSSSLNINPATSKPYGADFPATTARDDVNAQKLVLDALGVSSVAAVVGGSMGGMTALEWGLCTPPHYVKTLVTIATSLSHSAWGIAWAETQRQCIQNDSLFRGGHYEPHPSSQPASGLAAARMIAMLTYRSSTSFEARFGRKPNKTVTKKSKQSNHSHSSVSNVAVNSSNSDSHKRKLHPHFSVQGYLGYQGSKFLSRFDANCYLHLLNKMDSHDICRGRATNSNGAECPTEDDFESVLSAVEPGALVVGVESDILFTPEEQRQLANALPDARLHMLSSTNGHDGFLLDFEDLDRLMIEHLQNKHPQIYEGEPLVAGNADLHIDANGASMVGEMEE